MLYPIDYIIEKAAIIKVLADGFSFHIVHGPNSSENVLVTHDDLRSRHAHGVGILQAMVDYRKGPKTVMASWLKATIALQQGQHPLIPSTAGEFRLEFISQVCASAIEKHTGLKIGTYRVRTIDCPPAGAVPYVVDRHPEYISVPDEWLNQQYPGWDERLNTGRALDLTDRELVDYVFVQPSPSIALAIPDISFE